MRGSPERGGTSLHHNQCNFHYDLPSIENVGSGFFEDAIRHYEDRGIEYEDGNTAEQCPSFGNDFNQSTMAKVSLYGQRSSTCGPEYSMNSLFDSENGCDKGRDQGNMIAISRSNCRNPDTGGDSLCAQDCPTELYNFHRKSVSIGSYPTAPMQSSTCSLLQHAHCPLHVSADAPKYTPFQNLFDSSAAAKSFRNTSMRFGRTPWKAPEQDATINEVETNRLKHVERIYNAMVRGDIARDNQGSTAMKRWVYDAKYPSALVEAYSHKVFDAMLEQVKIGFRGWDQNDYVLDERKGEDDDRDVDCAARLDNIITALEKEKSICENVMSSSSQIRMFVNAPKAYSKRKNQNRVGNGKRPNAKGLTISKSDLTPAQKRRTDDHHASKRSSDLHCSRENTTHKPRHASHLPHGTPSAAFQKFAMTPPTSSNSQAHSVPAICASTSRNPGERSGLSAGEIPSPTLASFSPLATPGVPSHGGWTQFGDRHQAQPGEFGFPNQADDHLLRNWAEWEQQSSTLDANLSTEKLNAESLLLCIPKANNEAVPSDQEVTIDQYATDDFINILQQQNGTQPFYFG